MSRTPSKTPHASSTESSPEIDSYFIAAQQELFEEIYGFVEESRLSKKAKTELQAMLDKSLLNNLERVDALLEEKTEAEGAAKDAAEKAIAVEVEADATQASQESWELDYTAGHEFVIRHNGYDCPAHIIQDLLTWGLTGVRP